MQNRTLALLDFLLASHNVIYKIYNIKITPSFKLSDQCPFTFSIASNSMSPGSGFWRFDNNVLTDPIYVHNCKYVIRSTAME